MVFRAVLLGLFSLGVAVAAPPPSLKPAPPEPPHVSREEASTLRAVFEALDDRDYDGAKAARAALSDDLARRIADWAVLHSRAPDLSLAEYDIFLDQNPEWPNAWTLQRKAEQLIDDETPAGNVLAFFDSRDPLTGFGKLHLARTLFELNREDAATGFLQSAWIEHNYTDEDVAAILARYGRYLSAEDHFAKADRILFHRGTAGLEDVRGLLPEAREREVEARTLLLRGRSAGTELFNALPPESQRDPGVLHAMVRYLRREEREPEAIELAKLAPLNPAKLRDPEAWFYERKLLARWAMKNGRFGDAYALSAYSGLTEGADFAEAEFLAGWVALRFLNDPGRARAHFDFLTAGVSTPISLARGNYWLGRAYAAMGDDLRSRAHYLVAADFPYTYYGQMAIETLGGEAPVFSFPEPKAPTPLGRKTFMARPLTKAVQILDHIDQPLTYRRFALALDDQLQTEDEVRAFAELMKGQNQWDLMVRAGKVTRNQGAAVPDVIYPLYPVPQSAVQYAELPLILGLSRQESEFRADVVSPARAKGLMQLINSTARITARKEGLPYSPTRLLTDPNYNLTLGAAHLSHLVERFGGSYVMVLAAYNAGPHRVDEWVETYGDPRDPGVDPVDWVELIPFSETRNYVMRVLENTQVYRSRIEGLPLGIQLAEDLTRGSTADFASIGQPIPAPRLWQAGGLEGLQALGPQHTDELPLAVMRARPFPDLAEIGQMSP